MVYLVITCSSCALWQNSDTGILVKHFVHMKLHPVIHGHSACNWISVLLVFSWKISPLGRPFTEGKFDPTVILFLIASPHRCSFCAVSTYLNCTGYESVLAYTKGKGIEKSGGCAHRTYIRLISCFSTISCLVPPACNRKAHSLNMLNGGSVNEIVKRKVVSPVGAKATVQVSHSWKHLLLCPVDMDPF